MEDRYPNEEKVLCPLIDGIITPVDCMENRDIREEAIPDKFKQKPDWKEICKNCKYYEY
jgi:hypothetical protein